MQPEQSSELMCVDERYLAPLVARIQAGPESFSHAAGQLRNSKEANLNYFNARTADDRPYDLVKGVAILPLRGFLAKRSWWADTSYDRFSDWVRFAVADSEVKVILIDCDSPGGSVLGMPDCCDVVYQANNSKRVIACVNDLCASAALNVASAAREICVTQSGIMGSIGVYEVRIDVTEMLKKQGISVDVIRAGEQKAWGLPYLPMSDAERKTRQREVNDLYRKFIDAVARNRRTDSDRVAKDWADAKIFTGHDARAIGLADYVCSVDQLLTALIGPAPAPGSTDRQPPQSAPYHHGYKSWLKKLPDGSYVRMTPEEIANMPAPRVVRRYQSVIRTIRPN